MIVAFFKTRFCHSIFCSKTRQLTCYMQVDLCAEEIGNNVRPAVALLGDINAVMAQVTVDQLISLIGISDHLKHR